jgi:hypothetical protein
VKLAPSRAPRLHVFRETRSVVALAIAAPWRASFCSSPNKRLQRTRSAPLRSPLSRKPFGARQIA